MSITRWGRPAVLTAAAGGMMVGVLAFTAGTAFAWHGTLTASASCTSGQAVVSWSLTVSDSHAHYFVTDGKHSASGRTNNTVSGRFDEGTTTSSKSYTVMAHESWSSGEHSSQTEKVWVGSCGHPTTTTTVPVTTTTTVPVTTTTTVPVTTTTTVSVTTTTEPITTTTTSIPATTTTTVPPKTSPGSGTTTTTSTVPAQTGPGGSTDGTTTTTAASSALAFTGAPIRDTSLLGGGLILVGSLFLGFKKFRRKA